MPTATPSPDVTKLPRWAQSRIMALEQQAAHLQEIIAMTTGEAQSAIEVVDYKRHEEPSRFLPVNSRIRFKLGPHQSIDAALRNGQVEIMASSNVLRVYPRAANSIYIDCEK